MDESKSSIFRREALEGMDIRDLKGELPTMFRQRFRFAFWLLAAAVLAVLAWGLHGRINENVYGGGVITRYAQYGGVVSPGTGVLVSLDVEEGDTIRMGQMIGRIFSNDDFVELLAIKRLQEYQEGVFREIKAQVEKIKTEKLAYATTERDVLDKQLVRIEEQLKWYDEFLGKSIPKLAEAGAVSRLREMELREANNTRLREHEQVLTSIIARKITLADQFMELDRLLRSYDLELRRTRFDAEQKMHLILYRSRVISYCSGVVTNVNVNSGDAVSRGEQLLRITDLHSQETQVWSAYCYFSAADAHRIAPGMRAVITPSTVKAERDGSIYGTVAEVGRDLETRESLLRFYRNNSFAEFVFTSCKDVPVLVKIILSRNSGTPSGFNWTSGTGPDIPISTGTLCSVGVTTERHSPLNMLLGKVRNFVSGSGVMESERGFNALSLSSGTQQR